MFKPASEMQEIAQKVSDSNAKSLDEILKLTYDRYLEDISEEIERLANAGEFKLNIVITESSKELLDRVFTSYNKELAICNVNPHIKMRLAEEYRNQLISAGYNASVIIIDASRIIVYVDWMNHETF
jgi:hypothetical protein